MLDQPLNSTGVAMPYGKIVAALCAIAVLFFLGFGLPEPVIRFSFRHLSYYFLFSLLILWLYKLLIRVKGPAAPLIKKYMPAFFLSIILTCLIFSLSPPRFKTLTDEANLIGTSMLLYTEKMAGVPADAVYVHYGNPIYTIADPKRPLLYPFLVSLLHTLIGYDPSNGLLLNFFVSIGIFISFYILVTRVLAKFLGYVGLLLLASCPIYSYCITSSGFEGLNLLFLILFFIALHNLLESPKSASHLYFLALTALLFIQCRYESIVVVAIVGIIVLPSLYRSQTIMNIPYTAYFLPLFSLPFIWQRLLHHGKPEINKMASGAFQVIENPFSITNFVQNIDNNIFVLLGLNPDYGYCLPISIAAITGIYVTFKRIFMKKPSKINLTFFMAGSLSFIGLLFLISCFFWGNFTIHMDIRLSLVFSPFIVFASLLFIYYFLPSMRNRNRVIVILLCVSNILYYWPAAAKQVQVKMTSLPYKYENVVQILNRNYPHRKGHILIIAEYPVLYTIRGYSSVRFDNPNLENFFVNSNPFERVVVIQRIEKRTGQVIESNQLPLSGTIKNAVVFSLTPAIAVRIAEWIPSPARP